MGMQSPTPGRFPSYYLLEDRYFSKNNKPGIIDSYQCEQFLALETLSAVRAESSFCQGSQKAAAPGGNKHPLTFSAKVIDHFLSCLVTS